LTLVVFEAQGVCSLVDVAQITRVEIKPAKSEAAAEVSEMHPPDSIDIDQLAIFRAMTPAQRVEGAMQLNRFARQLLAGKAKTDHPQWSQEQIEAEVARRMLAAALAEPEVKLPRP
jgi:hypothetical protein